MFNLGRTNLDQRWCLKVVPLVK